MDDDGLSRVHYKAVSTEIAGRFFSLEEACRLKEDIEGHTITDSRVRAMAAISWESKLGPC
jgi:hypothetical protein